MARYACRQQCSDENSKAHRSSRRRAARSSAPITWREAARRPRLLGEGLRRHASGPRHGLCSAPGTPAGSTTVTMSMRGLDRVHDIGVKRPGGLDQSCFAQLGRSVAAVLPVRVAGALRKADHASGRHEKSALLRLGPHRTTSYELNPGSPSPWRLDKVRIPHMRP